MPARWGWPSSSSLVGGVCRRLETLSFEAIEPQADTVALPVQHLATFTGFIQENEKHRTRQLGYPVRPRR